MPLKASSMAYGEPVMVKGGIDGATEPFIYGGIPGSGIEPIPLDERCVRFARRLRRWNRLRTAQGCSVARARRVVIDVVRNLTEEKIA